MPTRLLLEGRDLEELLAQVRDEHGPDARIVSAEKVRTGGIAGLFSHPKYELTVEVGDPRAESGGAGPAASEPAAWEPAAPEPAAPVSIEELAARADAADLIAGQPADPPAADRPTTASAASFAAALAGMTEPAGVPGEAEPATAVPDKPPTAADVLNRLLADAPPEGDERATAPSVRPFRPSANQPVARLGVRPLSATPPPSTHQSPSTHQLPSTHQSPSTHANPSSVSATNTDTVDLTAVLDQQEAPVPVDVPEAVATVDRPRTGEASERLAAVYGTTSGTGATSATGAGGRTDTTHATQATPATGATGAGDRPNALPRRLQSLGVPADLAFRATSGDMYTAIVEAFAALPIAAPAPDGPGETLIVIGESTHAIDVARTVADTLRLDHDDILFAGRNALAAGIQSRRRVTGAHDARIWAKRLRKSDAPSIVAVEATLDESPWAASIVDAIRPAAVWCVVDASRKTSDVAHHLQGLRRVDAIAVRGTLASGDPASPLTLRIPIALLDGRMPNAHAWAAMLCERLSLVGG